MLQIKIEFVTDAKSGTLGMGIGGGIIMFCFSWSNSSSL